MLRSVGTPSAASCALQGLVPAPVSGFGVRHCGLGELRNARVGSNPKVRKGVLKQTGRAAVVKTLAIQKNLVDQYDGESNVTPNQSFEQAAQQRQELYARRAEGSGSEPQRVSPQNQMTTEVVAENAHSPTSLSGRALATAWSSPPPPPPKKTPRQERGAIKPYSPPSYDSPTPPTPATTESNRAFHSAHSREGIRSPAAELKKEKAQSVSDAVNATTIENKPPPLAKHVMNIIVVASECAPWSKTGGLGDVVGALPKALARRGHRVMVVAPRYSNYEEAWETGVRRIYNVSGQDMEVGYFHSYRDGVDFVFIDSPLFHAVANNIYGGTREEVLTRMILFCKAAVEIPWHVPCGGVCYGDGNLLFVANDWHTALVPVYLQAYYRDNGFMNFARSILVIHNMAHQGRGPISDFSKLGLPDHYMSKFRLYDKIGGEHNNIFMAGLISAHQIVTVSHGYAWEVQTQEGGWGLDGVIRDHNWKLRGVVNGIDDTEWNPEVDVHLKSDGYSNFSVETLNSGKSACKAALQRELGLPVRADVPFLGFIGRLDSQKGIDVIAQAMPWLMDQDVQLVLLGTGRKDYEEMLQHFEGAHRDKVRGWVGFSVQTAHRITAGVDILLMPSRFEPCGLNQLYAMRYGTVPVVHAVGGLRDTVQPFNPFNESGLGWTFDTLNVDAFIHALGNAMWTYRDFKLSWKGIQQRGMTQDLSWDHAAELYEDVLLAAKYTW